MRNKIGKSNGKNSCMIKDFENTCAQSTRNEKPAEAPAEAPVEAPAEAPQKHPQKHHRNIRRNTAETPQRSLRNIAEITSRNKFRSKCSLNLELARPNTLKTVWETELRQKRPKPSTNKQRLFDTKPSNFRNEGQVSCERSSDIV